MATLNLRDFPDNLHKWAKVQAAQEGITLRKLFEKAVEAYLIDADTKEGILNEPVKLISP